MATEQKKSLIDRLWRLLCSVGEEGAREKLVRKVQGKGRCKGTVHVHGGE
ncbi:MAG: hypothetical protein GY820_18365 [Gammaproteobacteria bacterium]|nr:hypothetical protein [Gammaproteobacteria bacterium]